MKCTSTCSENHTPLQLSPKTWLGWRCSILRRDSNLRFFRDSANIDNQIFKHDFPLFLSDLSIHFLFSGVWILTFLLCLFCDLLGVFIVGNGKSKENDLLSMKVCESADLNQQSWWHFGVGRWRASEKEQKSSEVKVRKQNYLCVCTRKEIAEPEQVCTG